MNNSYSIIHEKKILNDKQPTPMHADAIFNQATNIKLYSITVKLKKLL